MMKLTCGVRRFVLSVPKVRVYTHKTECKRRTVAIRFSSTVPQSNNAYCVDLVRKYDYENYLGTLLLPKDSQRAAFALRAYNVELALVRDTVTDKKIGLMKMQFWKDTIESLYQSSPPQTPVATELSGASQLENDSFTSVKSVEDYAEHVNSSLYYLLLECLGIKNVNADHAASHLGKAQGLVTVLRAAPHHIAKRRVYLPMEVLAKHKVSQEDILRGKNSQPVKDSVFDVASLANQHLEKARSLQKLLPDKTYLVFLNARICDHYLKNLQKVDFHIFDGKLQWKNPLLPYHMYINKLRRKF